MRSIHSFLLLCTAAVGTSGAVCQSTLPVVEQSYTGDDFVQVVAVTPKAGYTATLTAYGDCSAGAASISAATDVTAANPIDVPLTKPLTLNKGDKVCVREHFDSAGKLAAIADLVSQSEAAIDRAPGVLLPSDNSTAAFSRISLGVDVSASSSVDPGANFLLDGAFESPLSNNSTPFKAPVWMSGYVRLASIAQPGAVSGLSDVATYIKPLTAASPNQLVQSAEGNIGLEAPFNHPLIASQFVVISGIIDAGIITPLSLSQANPTVYIVDQAIYNYYTTTPVPNAAANTAITAACGGKFGAISPCYLAYLPQDRTRFFRNYAAGITLKKYYYNGGDSKADDSFGFPGYAIFTLGQNEYVSAGRFQGLILHVSASWPLPSTLSQKWGGSIYVYGGIDTNLRGKNTSDTQFLLQTAGSTITPTSANVALLTLPQEDRDRYRFGVGVDVVKLVQILTSKSQ